jgi:prephenate dehydrogenase
VTERFLPVVGQPSTAADPIFDRIGIVGLGLIGGSIALAARQLWPKSLVIGVDDKDVLEKAMVLHAIDVAADDLVVLAEAEIVVLAAPVRENMRLLGELGDAVRVEAIVTDTGSTKRLMASAARQLPPHLTFVGGHPLGGSARGGIERARAELFAGRPWIFTPAPSASPAALEKLEAFVAALGARPHRMTPPEHDRLLASISHLPQLTASALMKVVGESAGPEGLALSGRGLLDTTRLAASPSDIWRDIAATNADQLEALIDRLIAELQELRDGLADGDRLDETFEAANKWRAVLTGEEHDPT